MPRGTMATTASQLSVLALMIALKRSSFKTDRTMIATTFQTEHLPKSSSSRPVGPYLIQMIWIETVTVWLASGVRRYSASLLVRRPHSPDQVLSALCAIQVNAEELTR